MWNNRKDQTAFLINYALTFRHDRKTIKLDVWRPANPERYIQLLLYALSSEYLVFCCGGSERKVDHIKFVWKLQPTRRQTLWEYNDYVLEGLFVNFAILHACRPNKNFWMCMWRKLLVPWFRCVIIEIFDA